MALIVQLGLHILCLAAIASAIPVSLIEDIKDAQLQSPLRTNKVKRAQEVLMFGNQQNRAMNNYANQRAEKRDVGDNSLTDDVATLPNLLPQVEDQNYETNQIGSVDKAYPYIGADPAYGLVLRNAALKESLRNEPVMSYGDLSLYNMVDARRKRESPKPTPQYPPKMRSKRDYDLSPEELVSLLKMLESQRKPNIARFRDQSDNVWPLYTPDNEDFDLLDNQEENEVENEADYNRGVWMNGPVPLGSGQQDGHLWPRKLKRFMVSKRRPQDVDNLSQINLPYDFPEGLPLQRRFIL